MNMKRRVLTKKTMLVVLCLTLIGLGSALTIWQWINRIKVNSLKVESNVPKTIDVYSGFNDTYTINVTNQDSSRSFKVSCSCYGSTSDNIIFSVTRISEKYQIVDAGETITFTIAVDVTSGNGTLGIGWEIKNLGEVKKES